MLQNVDFFSKYRRGKLYKMVTVKILLTCFNSYFNTRNRKKHHDCVTFQSITYNENI